MALKKSYEEKTGQIEANAYHRVIAFELNLKDKSMRYEIGIWINEQAYLDGKEVIKHKMLDIFNWVDDSVDPPVEHNDYDDFMKKDKLNETVEADLQKWCKDHETYYSDAIEV